MEDLPSDIIVDVLSRLPAMTILHCRMVSKTWLELLSSSEFVKQHLARSQAAFIINPVSRCSRSDEDKLLRVIQIRDNMTDYSDHLHYSSTLTVDHSSINTNIRLIGSSNGFLLFTNILENNLFICNPILQEYITLPKPESVVKGEYFQSNGFGFGFGFSSRNGQYKVIRMDEETFVIGSIDHPRKFEIQVYTLGSGSWRSVEYVYNYFDTYSPGVQLNGYLHWFTYRDEKPHQIIYSFDVNHESSQLLYPPHPPNAVRYTNFNSIGVLDGRLCLCKHAPDIFYELWIMKEYGVENSWSKQYVISMPWSPYSHLVYALTTLKDGEILFKKRFEPYLISYHPEKKTTTLYQIRGCSPCDFDVCADVLSFLSLKNFVAEEEVKKFRARSPINAAEIGRSSNLVAIFAEQTFRDCNARDHISHVS